MLFGISLVGNDMKFTVTATAILLMSVAPALMSQTKPAASATSNPIVTTVRQMEERYSKNLIGAAEEMPADKYAYHPTEQQISFAHLMMHVAQSNNSLCAAIAGEKPREMKLSETDSKDMLTKVLEDSFAYCEQSLAKADDTELGQPATLFAGHTSTRGAAMVHLAADWADHYSAAAMYLRLNGLLPPSAKKAEGKER